MMEEGEHLEEAEEEAHEEETSEETDKPKPKQEFILHYERLCRGESNRSQSELDKLTCYYYNKHPLLAIKPVKIEIASLNPHIYLLHDIIRDEDIEFIKDLAAPRLERATVTNRNTGNLEFADYRISKSGWLDDEEGEPIMRLNRRLEAITGLSTASRHTEALQVVNYGIAGHYEPHVDHARSEKSAIFQMGMRNRIATVLIYVSGLLLLLVLDVYLLQAVLQMRAVFALKGA
ncbi:prolyl 4-hydroxylase subunit alpha-1-like [Orbicella faveolata]|uniref:prolyl 4-hydroxylase subunit alpha-1-like n=1 Tax=Orbicella faveolata TaxID=48498 RepID=UPI0009E583E5|nr:prolyl 4-hydroxylase subunit alpha-1-like [Orbicella faveolata]